MTAMHLEYERGPDGNLRLIESCADTGVEPSQRVVESPGAARFPAKNFGTVEGLETMEGFKGAHVLWDRGWRSWVNLHYLQKLTSAA